MGIAGHNGWAVWVCVAMHKGAAEVVDRRRVELIDAGLPNQPYEHETRDMNMAQAEALVRQVRESALVCAERAVARVRSDFDVMVIGKREPVLPRMPASVAEVRASHHLMARADAMLYDDALCQAAAALGIAVERFAKGDDRCCAAQVLGMSASNVDTWLAGLRATLGAPWQKDHQDATARAIAAWSRVHAAA